MCDLAYVNLLREKVRQLEGEEKRALRDVRFKPYVKPVHRNRRMLPTGNLRISQSAASLLSTARLPDPREGSRMRRRQFDSGGNEASLLCKPYAQ